MLNKSEFKNHLANDLLPFWNNLHDKEYGGFYGRVDCDNIIYEQSDKSAILQARILWFYSSCFKSLRDNNLLDFADAQFKFISEYMLDPDGGGIYWSVERGGKIKEKQQHAYSSAFALYAVSAYYSASKSETALTAANKLFNLIEGGFKDEYGYFEPFIIDRHIEHRYTMNTLLHIIEAYTEYYQIVKSDEARNALAYALNLVINKAYNDDLSRIECYFNKFMNPVGDILSYGHDIEASWLIYRACEILGNDAITGSLAPKLEKVAQNVIKKGFIDDGRNGVYYDCTNGVENKMRSWWVMAEAIVALVHRYNLYKNAQSMILAENLWRYVKAYFISPHGEWYGHLNDGGEVIRKSSDLCNAWKCPYHNGRMCLEMLKIL